jgi:hypothetical protein
LKNRWVSSVKSQINSKKKEIVKGRDKPGMGRKEK